MERVRPDTEPSLHTLNTVVFPQQICVPKADEWTRFVRTLAEINENRDEAEELANVWRHNSDWRPTQHTTLNAGFLLLSALYYTNWPEEICRAGSDRENSFSAGLIDGLQEST